MSSPIQYTSRTYQTIMNDINAVPELRDKPEWWKRIWAGVGDMLSVYLNAQANNSYLRTAFTRQAVADLCALIDYELAPRSTSSGLLVYNWRDSTTWPITLTAVNQVAQTAGTVEQSAKRFEGRANVTQVAQPTGSITAVDTGQDLLTVGSFQTGEKVRFSSTGNLPAPLVAGTNYWAIRVNSTQIRVSTSLANAIANVYIDITSVGTGALSFARWAIYSDAYQQRSIAQYSAGQAFSGVVWQEFDLADKNIIKDTLSVTINSIAWQVLGTPGVESSFVFYGPTDQVVQLVYNSDETAKLRFGDGTYGEIPGNFEVFVAYAVGGGAESNASRFQVSLYAGNEGQVESVINPTEMTGGANAENIDRAKILAPLLLKARDRFVTVGDGEALVLGYGGISNVRINPNTYGLLSCQVLGVANGGGNLSAGVRADLQQYLIDRTILESIDVRVEEITFITVAINADIAILGGFSWAVVSEYAELAFRLYLSETGQEIVSEYRSSGVVGATELINDIFSATYDASDYGQIDRLVSNLRPREIGVDIQASDILGYIDSFVDGVDYVIITSPAFPVAIGSDEISTDGAITLTQI